MVLLWTLKRSMNGFENSLKFTQYLTVPESQHAKAIPCKRGIALLVGYGIRMLSTIDFDHELPLDADKIQDICVVGMLTPELAAANLASSKRLPQPSFRIRRCIA